jgi:hypothetical protein
LKIRLEPPGGRIPATGPHSRALKMTAWNPLLGAEPGSAPI